MYQLRTKPLKNDIPIKSHGTACFKVEGALKQAAKWADEQHACYVQIEHNHTPFAYMYYQPKTGAVVWRKYVQKSH